MIKKRVLVATLALCLLAAGVSLAGTIGPYKSGKLANERAVAQKLRQFSESENIYTVGQLNRFAKDTARLVVDMHRRQVRELHRQNTKRNVPQADKDDIDAIISTTGG